MAKFILIEPSLEGIGAHYFEYATHVLGAAERRGLSPILACHRSFDRADLFPRHWPILPIFPDRPGRLHRLSREFEYSARTWRGWWDRCLGWPPVVQARLALDRVAHAWRPVRYQRRLGRFCRACAQVLERFPLAEGDHVLLSTTGDLDLIGLRRFLGDHPSTQAADWHMQFHYAIFQGRDADYPPQLSTARGLQARLKDLVASLPDHRLHFYTTTDNMARQYNALSAARFWELPYPVNPQFFENRQSAAKVRVTTRHPSIPVISASSLSPMAPDEREGDGRPASRQALPLRIACAGGMRREKGAHVLGKIVASIPDRYRRQVEFLVQSDSPAAFRRYFGSNERFVRSVAHPLTAAEYVDHICRADMGLLAYDSGQYWVRCSGVLVEMLCAAVPVVVMAGNWLAEQISPSIQRHLKSLAETAASVVPVALSRNEHADTWCATAELPREQFTDVVASFRCEPPTGPGRFVRVDAEQFDAAGSICAQFASTVSQPQRGEPVHVVFRIDGAARTMRLRWRSEFGGEPLAMSSAMLHFPPNRTRLPGEPDKGHPHGSVGLIASDTTCVAALLCHLVDHHPHFRRTAEQFSHEWQRMHHPDHTLTTLLAHAADRQHPPAARAA